jgi:WD40 repeat protein
VSSVAFSPDSRWCATAGRDGRTLVWSAEDGEVRCEIAASQPDVAEAAFTRDGAALIVGERSGRVTLHRASDGALLRELARSRHGFDHLALSPDGTRVALAAESLTLIDLERGGIVGAFQPHLDRPFNLEFDASGTRLASCSTDGSIAITDTRPLRQRFAARAAALAARERAAPLVERRLAAGEGLGGIAASVWSDAALSADERAAWIEALTLRAAAGRR